MPNPRITTEGEWEVVLLSEAHSALAGIVSPFLYSVQGPPLDQNIWFQSAEHFDLFLIRLVELIAAGQRLVQIDGQARDVSLVEGLSAFAQRWPQEAESSGLGVSTERLTTWLDTERTLSFWCGELGQQIAFPATRRDLIWIAGNCAKHGMLRLSNLLDKLERRLCAVGIELAPPEIIAALEEMDAEVRSRLEYHSTTIAELLGNVFVAVNRIVLNRHDTNPTNDARRMIMPDGLSSDVFRNIYGSTLVFKRYDENKRILALTPKTSKYLQMRF